MAVIKSAGKPAEKSAADTRKKRCKGGTLGPPKTASVDAALRAHEGRKDKKPSRKSGGTVADHASLKRVWLNREYGQPPPQPTTARCIGEYSKTTALASWALDALVGFQPDSAVQELVKPFAAEYHALCEEECVKSRGFHDIDTIELAYQCALELGAAILLAADATNEPVSLDEQLHASQAGGDGHFKPWSKLLTGLECDPPIIVQFPFYFLMCQAFTMEPNISRYDYVYSALTCVDWAKGKGKFNDRVAAFEALARASVPALDDKESDQDRCYWRLALGYLSSMNACENSRPFRAPSTAAIKHDLGRDLVIFARALDSMGSAYMGRDGASFLDNEGMDSLLGSGLANDVMDLHTDIFTGETRNLIRLLYPSGQSIIQTMRTTAKLLSIMLCEVFRGHQRARVHDREDGRISSTSPPYSFSRARHRRIFETLELYMDRYPQFWEWTWKIYNMAKASITEAALIEPLFNGLKRAGTDQALPESPANNFFQPWYDMVEDGSAQMCKPRPLGVSEDLAPVMRELHSLWHDKLRDNSKQPGWGRKFDYKSDMLLGEAGTILSGRGEICDDTYRFAIAYGRLSMGLPYVAYHTVDAIIMAYGPISLVRGELVEE